MGVFAPLAVRLEGFAGAELAVRSYNNIIRNNTRHLQVYVAELHFKAESIRALAQGNAL
jgi:hypothetical protein